MIKSKELEEEIMHKCLSANILLKRRHEDFEGQKIDKFLKIYKLKNGSSFWPFWHFIPSV